MPYSGKQTPHMTAEPRAFAHTSLAMASKNSSIMSPAAKYIAVNHTAQKPQFNSIDGSISARTEPRPDSTLRKGTTKLRSVLNLATYEGAKKHVATTYIKL